MSTIHKIRNNFNQAEFNIDNKYENGDLLSWIKKLKNAIISNKSDYSLISELNDLESTYLLDVLLNKEVDVKSKSLLKTSIIEKFLEIVLKLLNSKSIDINNITEMGINPKTVMKASIVAYDTAYLSDNFENKDNIFCSAFY